MAQLVADLRRVADGLQPDANRPPFVGWTVGRHWILDTIGHGTTPTR
jgi:hypothetical protein